MRNKQRSSCGTAAIGRFLCTLIALVNSIDAQVGAGPQPTSLVPSIETPRDIPFRGKVALSVDATDTAHKVFTVHETLPIQTAGPMVLLYPRWETGSHAATGRVENLTGLVLHAGDRRIEWRRDPVNVFAFHVDVPGGATRLDIDFQYLSPPSPRGGAIVMTPDIVEVPWQKVVLYSAGWFARDIAVQAKLLLPEHFAYATALEAAHSAGNTILFRTASLERLIDSPVYAGRYFERFDLAPAGSPPVRLDLIADAPADLKPAAKQIARLHELIAQTVSLFGSRHYAHYDFLVSLSDILPSSGGLEHLDSSEINLPADFFLNGGKHVLDQSLIPHEFVHSWNGLFRQPADLWTPNFNLPMRDSLLWVYEGQTQFWEKVLAVRSGLLSQQEALDMLAMDAAVAQAHVGRSWKSLQDSNNDPLFEAGHPTAWRDWQRREDYYAEGGLLWLDVDTRIRKQTDGKKSLEDFARAFFGVHDGERISYTYTFEDVCDALNQVAPFKWAEFLRNRLDAHTDDGLLDGLTRGGYRLIFTNVSTEPFRQSEADDDAANLTYSIGMSVSKTGLVKTVAWDGPAFLAGISIGGRITSVNDRAFDTKVLLTAVASATSTPIKLNIDADNQSRTVYVSYHGGLRYPRLERIPNTPALLDELFKEPLQQ